MTKLAVVFDLDGTLVDSAPDIHATANVALASVDLPQLDFAAVRGFIGRGVPHLLSQLLQAVDQDPSGPKLAPLSKAFGEAYEHAVEHTTLFPHVIETLDALATNGHKMAICTNKPEVPAFTILNHFGLSRFFNAVVGGDTLSVRKPDPAPLFKVYEMIGVSNALYVGDSETDAQTARNAAQPFALFTHGYRKATVAEIAPFAAFDDYRTLPSIIDDCSGRG